MESVPNGKMYTGHRRRAEQMCVCMYLNVCVCLCLRTVVAQMDAAAVGGGDGDGNGNNDDDGVVSIANAFFFFFIKLFYFYFFAGTVTIALLFHRSDCRYWHLYTYCHRCHLHLLLLLKTLWLFSVRSYYSSSVFKVTAFRHILLYTIRLMIVVVQFYLIKLTSSKTNN